MGSTTSVQITNFSGLNIQDDESVIADTELSECVNLDLGRAGELKKRTGFEAIHNGSTLAVGDIRILGLYQTSSVTQLLGYNESTDGLYYSTDGTTWTFIATLAGIQHAVQYAGVMYIIRTTGNIRSWNGTTLSADIAGSPAGTFGVIFKDRLWVFDSSSASLGSRLYFSAAGNLSSWPSTNFIDVQTGDGDFLVALGVLQDVLYVFKGRTTWGLFVQGSPENWVLRNLNPSLGCISKYALREVEGFLYFIGADAIYRTDGTTFRELSEPIASALRGRVVNTSTFNLDTLVYWEDKLICFISPTPSVQNVYVYHMSAEGWTQWELESITPWSYVEVYATSPSRGVYMGARDGTGRVYRFGDDAVYTDVNENYECRLQTKRFSFDQFEGTKKGKWITVDCKGEASLSAYNMPDGTTLAVEVLASVSNRTGIKATGPGYFRSWSYKIEFTNANAWTFFGLALLMIPKRTLIGNL